MRSFAKRSAGPELMDSETVSYAEFRACLRHISLINTLTLAHRPTRYWLKNHVQGAAPQKTTSIYDIGSGDGAMVRKIRQWAGRNVTLAGIDINPWSKKIAEEISPPDGGIRFETADVFALTLHTRPDYIISSLFTHHLSDPDLIRFIRWMDFHAAQGWFINDLHRHPLPYYFIWAVTRLFPFNRMVRHDAPVSVARAFTAPEWVRILSESGIPAERVEIKWFFPFRYGVLCRTT